MNVLAIHASPHKNKGNTARIPSPFPEGKAGELLVRGDSIPSSRLETISRPLIPQDDNIKINNQGFRELNESRRTRTPGTPERGIRMSVTERERGFPQQQGDSICFSHFLSGLISLVIIDTSGMKDPERICVTITPVKPDEP